MDRRMGKFDEAKLKSKLLKLSQRADSIQETAKYFFDLKKHADDVTQSWFQCFMKGDDNFRLVQLYLANEILQTCKRMNALAYKNALRNHLKACFQSIKDPHVLDKVARMLKIWNERKVLEETFIASLTHVLEEAKPPPEDDAMNKIIDSFNPDEPIDMLSKMANLENEVQHRLHFLDHLQVEATHYAEDPAISLSRIKDKEQGKQFTALLAEDHQHLQELQQYLQEQVVLRKKMVEMLENAELFYEHQMKEVDVVSSAYKDYELRIQEVERELLANFSRLPEGHPNDALNVPTLNIQAPLEQPFLKESHDYDDLVNLEDAPSPGNTPPHLKRSSYVHEDSSKFESVLSFKKKDSNENSSVSLQNKINRLVVDMDVSDEDNDDFFKGLSPHTNDSALLSGNLGKKAFNPMWSSDMEEDFSPPPPPPKHFEKIEIPNRIPTTTFIPPPPPPPPPPHSSTTVEDFYSESPPHEGATASTKSPSVAAAKTNDSQSTISLNENALDLISKISQLPGLLESLRSIQRSGSILPTPMPGLSHDPSVHLHESLEGGRGRSSPNREDDGGATPTMDEPMDGMPQGLLNAAAPFNPRMPPPPLGSSIPPQLNTVNTQNIPNVSIPWNLWSQNAFTAPVQVPNMPTMTSSSMFPNMFASLIGNAGPAAGQPRMNANFTVGNGNLNPNLEMPMMMPPRPNMYRQYPSMGDNVTSHPPGSRGGQFHFP